MATTPEKLSSIQRIAVRPGLAPPDLGNPGVDIATVPGRTAAWQSVNVTPLFQSNGQPYVLSTDDNHLVAFALLRHAPNEMLRVAILQDDKQPRIVVVDIFAMH